MSFAALHDALQKGGKTHTRGRAYIYTVARKSGEHIEKKTKKKNVVKPPQLRRLTVAVGTERIARGTGST